MKKTSALITTVVCGAALLLASLGAAAGTVPTVLAAGIMILAFPTGVMALFLWWSAGAGEEDIPFLGY